MISTVQKAAKEAGNLLVKYFKKGVSPSYKTSHQNLLTQADIGSQKVIQSSLLKSMVAKGFKKREIGFIDEENLDIKGKHTFIIDPLDGTTNFACGIRYFCISIAYAYNNQIKAGVVYNPLEDVFYLAGKTRGAYKQVGRKQEKLKIQPKSLKQCLAGTFITTKKQYQNQIYSVIERINPQIRAIRIMGGIALSFCQLAENIFNVYFEAATNIWDIAAAKLIVEESGGTVVNWQGKKLSLDFNNRRKSYQIIACHSKVLPAVLKFF